MLPARKPCKIHGFGRRRFPKPGKTQGFGRLPARKHCKIQGFGRRRFPKPGKTQGFGMVPIRKPCKTQCLGLLQEPTRDPWDPPGSPQKSGGPKKKTEIPTVTLPCIQEACMRSAFLFLILTSHVNWSVWKGVRKVIHEFTVLNLWVNCNNNSCTGTLRGNSSE